MLVGDVKTSQEKVLNIEQMKDFLLEIESVMEKYKVVKVDLAFDVFAMIRQKK